MEICSLADDIRISFKNMIQSEYSDVLFSKNSGCMHDRHPTVFILIYLNVFALYIDFLLQLWEFYCFKFEHSMLNFFRIVRPPSALIWKSWEDETSFFEWKFTAMFMLYEIGSWI